MDFASLFSQFAPQLTGLPSAGAGGAFPAASGPAPAPMGAQPSLPNVLPVQAPMGRPPQPGPQQGPKITDMLPQIAAMVLSAFTAKKNPMASAALIQGLIRGQQTAAQQRMQVEEKERERRALGVRYMQQVAADAANFSNLEEFQQYLNFAEKIGAEFGIQPGTLTQSIPFPKTRVAEKKRRDAQARLEALENDPGYKHLMNTPQEANLSVTLPDGEQLTVKALRERAGMQLVDQSGAAVMPQRPQPKEPVQNLTEFEQYLVAFAREKGTTPDKLTTKDIETAKKRYQQSDDKAVPPPDPSVAELRALNVELARLALEQRRKGVEGLPPRVQAQVASKQRGWDALPIVKVTQTIAQGAQFADSLDPNTQNPADDQALIYAFAKAMDPESVVREGEYATVQKYAQSWAQSLGFNAARIFSNTPFLTPKARANMKATIRAKFNAARTQYENVRTSYGSQINRITGGTDGVDYLTDYGGGFPDDPVAATAPGGRSAPAAAPAAPAGGGRGAPPKKVGAFEIIGVR